MEESKRLIKNSALNIVGNIFNKICGYFAVFLAIKTLGIVNYGYYTLGLTIISIGTVFSNMGLNYGVFRFIPIYRGMGDIEKVKGVIYFCGKYLIFCSFIISIIIYFSSNYLSVVIFNKPDLGFFINVLILSLPFTIISMLCSNIFKGFNLIKYKVLIDDVFVLVLRLIFFGSCFLFSLGTLWILYSYLITIIMGSLIGVYFSFIIFPELYQKTIRSVYNKKEIISYSFPLFLTSFLAIILNRTDVLMIGYYLPSEQVGIYSLANRFAGIVFLISTSIIPIFSPTIAELLGKGKKKEIKYYFINITKWTLIFTIPAFIIITIFSIDFLNIFGAEFTVGNSVVIILSTSFLFNSVLGLSGQVLSIMGRSKIIFVNSICAGILNIILNIILIPKYGLAGAAIATGISMFLVNIARTIEVFFFERLNALNLKLLIPISVGILCGGFIFYIKYLLNYKFNLFIMGGLIMGFCILYILLTFIFVINKEDKIFIRKIAMPRSA